MQLIYQFATSVTFILLCPRSNEFIAQCKKDDKWISQFIKVQARL